MIRETCKQRRLSLGITQAELAKKIGVRIATISDFENGRSAIRSSCLEKILQELNLSIKPAAPSLGDSNHDHNR